MSYLNKSVALIIPVYNEEQSIARVIAEFKALKNTYSKKQLIDDIVVCDNGSTDNTAYIVKTCGVRLVQESKPGYGAACLTAIRALNKPDIVIFADGDHSVLASDTYLLLDEIIDGVDLVIGCRILSLQEKYSLTPPQRFGNILASYLIRLIWHYPVTDLGPFRAINYSSLTKLGMADQKFGWTIEMQIKAIQSGLYMTEVPVSSLKRIGKSKISGTTKGTIGAAIGIFGTIFRLYQSEKKLQLHNITKINL